MSNVTVQEAIQSTINTIVDKVMDNYGLIDERTCEYVELTEDELRRILQETVTAVEETVHVTLGISQD